MNSRLLYTWARGLGLCAFATASLSLCYPAWSADAPAEDPRSMAAPLQNWTDRAGELIVRALLLAGIQYKFGGDSPESGLDCSGLVRYVFKEAWGTPLPRTAEEISRLGQRINVQELQPGDLVFYNTLRRAFSHVGIYLGDNKFIHSPSAGGKVRVEDMESGYWKKRFNGARRIAEPAQDKQPGLHPSVPNAQ